MGQKCRRGARYKTEWLDTKCIYIHVTVCTGKFQIVSEAYHACKHMVSYDFNQGYARLCNVHWLHTVQCIPQEPLDFYQ